MSTPPDPYNTPGDEGRSELPSFQPGGHDVPKPATRPEPPSSIVNAARLMFVGAAISAIGIIVTLTTTDTMREQLESDASLTAEDIDVAVSAGVASGVIFGIIAIGLWIWMALANKRGLSWARIVATVLGGLNVVFTLSSLALFPAAGLSLIASLVSVALAVVIIVLLFRPDSSQYYNATGEYRHLHGS